MEKIEDGLCLAWDFLLNTSHEDDLKIMHNFYLKLYPYGVAQGNSAFFEKMTNRIVSDGKDVIGGYEYGCVGDLLGEYYDDVLFF